MTIEEAIELLQQDLDDPGSVDILDLNHAQKLAIIALKRLIGIRADHAALDFPLLPVETEE